MIKFRCEHCGRLIRAPDGYAGKQVRCPNCENIIACPKTDSLAASMNQGNTSHSKGSSRTSDLDPALFDIPPTQEAPSQSSSRDEVPCQTLQDAQIGQHLEASEVESPGERKLPWIIDIFLYPANIPGLINLAMFIVVPMLIDILWPIVPVQLSILFGLGGVAIKALVFLYMYWYFAECIRDSAGGGLRAPNTLRDRPCIADMFWQMVNIVGCLFVFWAPLVFYILFARKAGVFFWLLLIYAVFFSPMALLAVVLFDQPSALDPRLLIRAVSSTFSQYSRLVLLLAAPFLLVGMLPKSVWQAEPVATVLHCTSVYLAFVAAHLLGRFYWRYQDKLNWEV